MVKEKLYGRPEWADRCNKAGRFARICRRQIADWLYRKEILSIDEMSNMSKKMRELLSQYYEIGLSAPENVAESKDGTKKYFIKYWMTIYRNCLYSWEWQGNNLHIITGWVQNGLHILHDRKTGFQGNLSSNEILNQFRSMPEYGKLTNMVCMGMGEPLDNIGEVLKSLEIMTAEWVTDGARHASR